MSGRGRGKRVSATTATVTNAVPLEIITKEAVSFTEAPPSTEVNTIVVPVEEKPAKKISKKKQFPVVAYITPEGIEGNLLAGSRRPLIVHLPLKSNEVIMNDMPITYNPFPPTDAQPYDSLADNPFCEDMEHLPETTMKLDEKVQETKVRCETNLSSTTAAAEPEVDFYTLKGTLLMQFKDTTERKVLPEYSDAACFWCCHAFTHRPVVLPTRDTGEHLEVMGNFCCPECACAYLFDIRQDSHTRWEQLALLYRVYGEACQGNIHPSPARATLKLFGGTLSIGEYRSLIRSYKLRIDVHLPPMVSILATMDTKPIDFYDSGLTKSVTETVKERLQKAEEVLRLRRTKPLKAWESTLDACLNLKIKHTAVV